MLEESPAVLIRSTKENFQIEPDLHTFNRIEESVKTLVNRRVAKLEAQNKSLAALTRQLELIKNSINTLQNSDANKKINNELISVDEEKFQLAKNLNDLESQIYTLRSSLNKLNDTYNEVLEEESRLLNESVSDNPDSTILKLKLYKNLGVKIVPQDENETKIVIYNQEKDTTSFLNVDDKYSDYFVSNYIWDRL